MITRHLYYLAALALLCSLCGCGNDAPALAPHNSGYDLGSGDLGSGELDVGDFAMEDVGFGDFGVNDTGQDADVLSPDASDASNPPPSCGAANCSSGEVCENQVCVAISCDDGTKNGEETDIDCGGATCEACWGEQTCTVDQDCKSGSCVAGQCSKNAFVSVWRIIDNPAIDDGTVRLPLVSKGNYDFRVDWGDGTSDIITQATQPEVTHQYAGGGVFTITIEGVLEGWSFYSPFFSETSAHKLHEIQNWGVLRLGTPANYDAGHDRNYFDGAGNLTISATDILDLTGTVSLESMFVNCTGLETVPGMNQWNVAAVTNMSGMFQYAYEFNQDISAWDVSSVSDMSHMFESAGKFNQDIGGWNVSSVTDMSFLFSGTTDFNQDIGGWNVSAVTNMLGMFSDAVQFNQDVGRWNTSSVTTMASMFRDAASFNQDVGSWNVSLVTFMANMFDGAALSPANYDALLLGWSSRPVSFGVPFHAGSATYSGAAAAARSILTNQPNRWSITDGGLQ